MNGPVLTEEEFFRGMPQTKPSNELQERILAEVDKIVITKNDYRDDTPPSLAMTNPEDVANFIALLEIDEKADLFYCMCAGDWRIDFFAGEQLKTSFTLHNTVTTRSDFWWGNASLLKPMELLKFMSSFGFTAPLDDYMKAKRRLADDQLAEEKWIEFSPKCFNKYLSVIKAPGEKEFAAIVNDLNNEIDDRSEQIRVLLQAYGQFEKSWKCHVMYSGIVARLMNNYETDEVAQAIADYEQNHHLKAGVLLFLKPDELNNTKAGIMKRLPQDVACDLEKNINQFKMPTHVD